MVAVVTIDPAISDEQRAHTLDSLGQEFRRGDIVGLRDDRTVVVTLQGVSRRVATNRLSELVDRFDLDDASGRAGFAMFPADGRSADELVEAALAAREMAIASGGPPVVSTTWRPASQQVAEVLIVESDPVLGRVLASVIAERGHPTKVLDNGNAALEWMTDPNRTAFPRLLLVDLDTPGLDGRSALSAVCAGGRTAGSCECAADDRPDVGVRPPRRARPGREGDHQQAVLRNIASPFGSVACSRIIDAATGASRVEL